MPLFFVTSGRGWGIGPTSTAALRRHASGTGFPTKDMFKEPFYVLEFPDDTTLDIGMLSNWSADKKPIRVVMMNGIQHYELKHLVEMCEESNDSESTQRNSHS